VSLLARDQGQALLLNLLDVPRTADEDGVLLRPVEVPADAAADGTGAVDDVTHALCSFSTLPVALRWPGRHPCRRPDTAGSL
jgi:hypothetical protein